MCDDAMNHACMRHSHGCCARPVSPPRDRRLQLCMIDRNMGTSQPHAVHAIDQGLGCLLASFRHHTCVFNQSSPLLSIRKLNHTDFEIFKLAPIHGPVIAFDRARAVMVLNKDASSGTCTHAMRAASACSSAHKQTARARAHSICVTNERK